jgi:hypothetical protein
MKPISARALLAPLLSILTLGAAAAACSGSESSEQPAAIDEAVAAETWAKAFCDVLFSCGCSGLRYPDKGACQIKERDHFEERRAEAVDKGLVFDGACLLHSIASVTERGCAIVPEIQTSCDPQTCFLFHGDKPVEDFCSVHTKGGFTDCVQGASCIVGEGSDGRCTSVCPDPIPPVADGTTCGDPNGGQSVPCEPSSWCDITGTGKCRGFPGTGESCEFIGLCSGDAFCSFYGTEISVCTPRKADGEFCESPDECEHRGCNDSKCGPGTPLICLSASSSAP